jgi:hypothetical protein
MNFRLAALFVIVTLFCAPTLLSAQAPTTFVGTPPVPGSIGLLVTAREVAPLELTAGLLASGCRTESLAILASGAWRVYVPGAPTAVNSAFPQRLSNTTAFFVRCSAPVLLPGASSTPPSTGARFATLPPGSALPTGAECTARVRRSPWEPRPQNTTANQTVPAPRPVSIGGASAAFNATFAGRIDGNFTGTTDEIIQWASCKWGFDEDVTRARAIAESFWIQSSAGDNTSSPATCAEIGKAAPCSESYGLLQVRFTAHVGTYPRAAESTAFNLDYTLANTRACYEGDLTWLNNFERGGTYARGDLWGCVGLWFSGRWYVNNQPYIATVQGHLAEKPWLKAGF